MLVRGWLGWFPFHLVADGPRLCRRTPTGWLGKGGRRSACPYLLARRRPCWRSTAAHCKRDEALGASAAPGHPTAALMRATGPSRVSHSLTLYCLICGRSCSYHQGPALIRRRHCPHLLLQLVQLHRDLLPPRGERFERRARHRARPRAGWLPERPGVLKALLLAPPLLGVRDAQDTGTSSEGCCWDCEQVGERRRVCSTHRAGQPTASSLRCPYASGSCCRSTPPSSCFRPPKQPLLALPGALTGARQAHVCYRPQDVPCQRADGGCNIAA